MFFHLNLIFHHRIYIFVKHWFQVPFSGTELKGNPVRIGNSPAAVSSVQCLRQILMPLIKERNREGAADKSKSEDLPMYYQIDSFRGLELENKNKRVKISLHILCFYFYLTKVYYSKLSLNECNFPVCDKQVVFI